MKLLGLLTKVVEGEAPVEAVPADSPPGAADHAPNDGVRGGDGPTRQHEEDAVAVRGSELAPTLALVLIVFLQTQVRAMKWRGEVLTWR